MAWIRYGLAGGFGGCGEWEETPATTQEEADRDAYEAACNTYESYVGLHGLREVGEIMDQEGVDEDEAINIYNEEREGWIDYQASMTKPDDA